MVGRGGRPWGLIRAESTEAEALANFLRAQVDASGKTLNTLAGEIHLSKTRISELLAGKIPGQNFVVSLIRATVPEPRLRERRLAQAEKLLWAAAHPSPVNTPLSVASALELAESRAQQIEVYGRLTRSLEQQGELREAVGNSTKLVMILLAMINKLEHRITDLTSERDQLHAAQADPVALEQTQQQLTRAQEQEQRAQQELQRAQEKQRQAEELAARVQSQVDQLTDELDRLRTVVANETVANSYASPAREHTHLAKTADMHGDDIDQALARAAAVNDHDDQLLKRITHDLVQDPPADGVVRDLPPDNPASGPIAADIFWALRGSAVHAAEAGDFHKAVQLYEGFLNTSSLFLDRKHPDTLAALRELAYWRRRAGDAAGEFRRELGLGGALGSLLTGDELLALAVRPRRLGEWYVEEPWGPRRLDEMLTDLGQTSTGRRHPVIAVGLNASPSQVAHQLTRLGIPAAVPMVWVRVRGIGVGCSGHVSLTGFVAAAPYVDRRAETTLVVTWLDSTQLKAVDDAEFPDYRRAMVPGDTFEMTMPSGERLAAAYVYFSTHGLLADPTTGRPRPGGGDKSDLLTALLADSARLRGLLGPDPAAWVHRAGADRRMRERAMQIFDDEGWVLPLQTEFLPYVDESDALWLYDDLPPLGSSLG